MRRRALKSASLHAVEPAPQPPDLDALSAWPDPRQVFRTPEPANRRQTVEQLLKDHFRCAGNVTDFTVEGNLSREPGYFRFGPDVICYGRCSSGLPAKSAAGILHDASVHVVTHGSSIGLPFDPGEVVDNLRCERYVAKSR